MLVPKKFKSKRILGAKKFLWIQDILAFKIFLFCHRNVWSNQISMLNFLFNLKRKLVQIKFYSSIIVLVLFILPKKRQQLPWEIMPGPMWPEQLWHVKEDSRNLALNLCPSKFKAGLSNMGGWGGTPVPPPLQKFWSPPQGHICPPLNF